MLVQGINAVFYFSIGPKLRRHLASRAAWVVRIERMIFDPRGGRGA
jgi:hypothetical protein